MKLTNVLVVLFLVLMAGSPVQSDEYGYITSIAYPVVEDEVFKVNINQIDGQNASGTVNYPATAGTHVVTLSAVPDPTLMPPLPYARSDIYYGEITVEVEAGKTYQLAAKVNPDATKEQQQSGDFWEPVLYKVE